MGCGGVFILFILKVKLLMVIYSCENFKYIEFFGGIYVGGYV